MKEGTGVEGGAGWSEGLYGVWGWEGWQSAFMNLASRIIFSILSAPLPPLASSLGSTVYAKKSAESCSSVSAQREVPQARYGGATRTLCRCTGESGDWARMAGIQQGTGKLSHDDTCGRGVDVLS